MRVIVLDHVFDGSVPAPDLFALLNFAFFGRHRVLVDRGPCFKRWYASLPDDARDRYDVALDTSEELEAREPSDHEICIGWGPVCAAIDDAIERLGRPFVLFLENEASDRAFLEAVASTHRREYLRKMHQRQWIQFRSRGGASHIETMMAELLKEFPHDSWRMFAIFDSDAAAPGEPPQNIP